MLSALLASCVLFTSIPISNISAVADGSTSDVELSTEQQTLDDINMESSELIEDTIETDYNDYVSKDTEEESDEILSSDSTELTMDSNSGELDTIYNSISTENESVESEITESEIDNNEDSSSISSEIENSNNTQKKEIKLKASSKNTANYYDQYTEYLEKRYRISAINHWGVLNTGPVLFWGDGTKTIRQISDETAKSIIADGRESETDINADGTIWSWHARKDNDVYIVENINGKYIVNEILPQIPNNNTGTNHLIPPKDGFILYGLGTSKGTKYMNKWISVGTELELLEYNKVNYEIPASNRYMGYVNIKGNKIPEAQEKEIRNNNLQPIDAASTLNKVNIELYNYNKNINKKWLSDNKYPGFQNPGLTAPSSPNYNSRNGNWSIISDLLAVDIEGAQNVGNHGDINKTSGNTPYITKFDSAISNKLNTEGYPQLKDNTSLSYLFREGEDDAVIKESSSGLDGLFQYDPETYTYHFNSRANTAIYNKDTNKFELYDALLTPNYTTYIFGNFMPFNNIQTAKRVSDIDRNYLVDLLSSTDYKKLHETNKVKKAQYEKLSNWIYQYIESADTYFKGTDWSYLDTINEVFQALGFHKDPSGKFDPLTNDDFDFSKLYAVDFDDEMDFWFAMTQEVNFYQPENGMVGRDNAYEMTYKFTGDDDFWLYIDGDLFIDLTGLHRHHGAEINFTKGTVSYYATDVNNDGDLIEEPVKVVKFSELVSDKSKLNEKGVFKDITDFENQNHTGFIEGYDEESARAACSHNLKLFYMERGSGSGVCRMNFNFPIIETNFEDANINLNIEKEIVGTDKSFNLMKLNKNDEYKFPITLKEIIKIGDEEILSGKTITGIVTNKKDLYIKNIPAGKYIISEKDDMYFDFVGMEGLNQIEGVRFTKSKDKENEYVLDIDTNIVEPNSTYRIKVKNEIEKDRPYEEKKDKVNLFKK